MNINGFRRWLKAQIVMFDDDTECAADRADETVPTIRQAEQIALKMGLPEIARHCATVTTTLLALPVAQEVLCECLEMLPKPVPDGSTLTVTEAASLLKVNRDKILGWINAGRIRAANTAKADSRLPRYRITRADLDAFLARRTKMTTQPTKRRRLPAAEIRYYPEV